MTPSHSVPSASNRTFLSMAPKAYIPSAFRASFVISSDPSFHHPIEPAFSQIYIYESDPMQQAQRRMSYHHGLLDVNIILSLQAMLHRCNPYVETFLTAHERLTQNANVSLRINLVDSSHYDLRRYNRPTANEVAVIMIGTGDESTAGRDFILQARNNRLQCRTGIHPPSPTDAHSIGIRHVHQQITGSIIRSSWHLFK